MPRLPRPVSLVPNSRALALGALCALAAGPAAALSLECSGPGATLRVDVEPAADRCVIDGARASLRKPHDPVVCHLSTPRLSILTIDREGGFTWEETDSDRIVRGACERV